MDVAKRFAGTLIGCALGDAIGELAFGCRDREQLFERVQAADVLRYTDDTAMTIALAESLLAVGDVDGRSVGDAFRAHFEREPWRGYGPGPPRIFDTVSRGECDYEEAARRLYHGEGSFGNGAAMRIAPVGLCFGGAVDLYEKVRTSAVVTHAHPVGVDGAAVQAKAVAVALCSEGALDADVFAAELIVFARTEEVRRKMERMRELLLRDAPAPQAARELGFSVAVHESMPFALYCFLRHPDSYGACLECAVLHGGDRDTMGAMAGAVSGARLGVEAIPADWWEKLENASAIGRLARRLESR